MSTLESLPWRVEYNDRALHADATIVGTSKRGCSLIVANFPSVTEAEFAVRACNSHDDLLEACRRMVADWKKCAYGNLAPAARICKAAIAKAEGRA